MAEKRKVSPPTAQSPYRLLVEGSADQHAIIHLLRRKGYDWDNASQVRPFVNSVGGRENMPAVIAVQKARRALGIVLDADEHPAQRWRDVKAWLADVVNAVPDDPHPDGLILNSREPGCKVGVWLMPDNRSQGALEDFVQDLVPPDDVCWDYAKQQSQAAKERYARGPQSFGYDLKSQLHTWLAWQDEPGMSFGQALNKKLLGCESPTTARFCQWFDALFPSMAA